MRKITLSALCFCAMLAIALTGCKQTNNVQTTDEAWYADDSALWAQLGAAIEVAKQLDSTKIYDQLMPIKKDYPGEEWVNIDGHDMVLVMTLVDSSRLERFFSGDSLYRIDREMGTWVSLPADWAKRSAAFEGLDSVAAHTRMLQMYGLSPDCDYNIMVMFYADPTYMFRPSPNPDITTTSAQLEFPAYADEKYKIGETNFREWYRYSVASAYEDDTPLPWTQMGYTYDWHEGADYHGVSEYIVTHQSLVKVKSHESVWTFIQSLTKK